MWAVLGQEWGVLKVPRSLLCFREKAEGPPARLIRLSEGDGTCLLSVRGRAGLFIQCLPHQEEGTPVWALPQSNMMPPPQDTHSCSCMDR